MIKKGDKAPDFTLEDAEGRTRSLGEFRGMKLVLYFYPRDDTPGCTKEACGFRDVYARIRAKGAIVVGVSPDSTASHAKFRDKRSPLHPACRSGDENHPGLRCLGRENHVREEVPGSDPFHLSHRRGGTGHNRFPEGEPRGSRRGNPRLVLIRLVATSAFPLTKACKAVINLLLSCVAG